MWNEISESSRPIDFWGGKRRCELLLLWDTIVRINLPSRDDHDILRALACCEGCFTQCQYAKKVLWNYSEKQMSGKWHVVCLLANKIRLHQINQLWIWAIKVFPSRSIFHEIPNKGHYWHRNRVEIEGTRLIIPVGHQLNTPKIGDLKDEGVATSTTRRQCLGR